MPYVVTQSCCADAACVTACPVNCIHPTPGEPGFAEAEMLYVDPDSCVDCGACATACPVDAVVPHTRLSPEQQPFERLNADYYDVFPHRDRAPLAIVEKQRRLRRHGPFRVAVIGAGPAGLYTADELLKHPEISVDVFDRLPTPYGLVRAGVAPDHPQTKQVQQLFAHIEALPGFGYILGVEVGRDVHLAQLSERYDAVVYAVGAARDKPLGIPGEGLTGSLSATDLVGWYNGHPDKQQLDVPLTHERTVVVGNGNVALDVARILTTDPARLEGTDIAALPWAALSRSAVHEVVLLGRRGPAEAAFTVPELIGLSSRADLDIGVDTGGVPIEVIDEKTRLLAELAQRSSTRAPDDERRRIVLRFHSSPVRAVGDRRVDAVEVRRHDRTELIETGLLLRAIGYRGAPVPDLPYDEITGVVPSDRGRVRTGLYVVGWAKRGPSGFIGTNKTCAQETVTRILDDLDAAVTPVPMRPGGPVPGGLAPAGLGQADLPHLIDLDGWRRLDAEERRRGAARGRPRAKIVDIDEMRRVASTATASPDHAPDRVSRYPSARRTSIGLLNKRR